MPRGTKCRQICAEYEHNAFFPQNGDGTFITLTIDELEAIRLCDYEGLDQGDCADRMEISRGTYQRILYSARSKVAGALVYNQGICIAGGNYKVAADACKLKKKCKRCKRKKE